MDTQSLWLITPSLLIAMTAVGFLLIHLLQVRKTNQIALYDDFHRNVRALAAAMDAGTVHPSLLFETRDQFWKIKRKGRSDVVMAATEIVELLKPAIDSGPTEEFFCLITRALDHFESVCRADAGLNTVPSTAVETARRARRTSERTAPRLQQQNFPDRRPDSAIQDHLDHEAALSQVFPAGGSSPVEDSTSRPAISA